MLSKEVLEERERCASLAEELAGMWEKRAAQTRSEGTFKTWSLWPPFRSVEVVAPGFENAAKNIEAAAHGCRAIALGIREGWGYKERKDEDASA